jgi:hypothetical protein
MSLIFLDDLASFRHFRVQCRNALGPPFCSPSLAQHTKVAGAVLAVAASENRDGRLRAGGAAPPVVEGHASPRRWLCFCVFRIAILKC